MRNPKIIETRPCPEQKHTGELSEAHGGTERGTRPCPERGTRNASIGTQLVSHTGANQLSAQTAVDLGELTWQ